MLQRDRQFRTQLYQLTDAAIFAFSFWVAYMVRTDHTIAAALNLKVVDPESFRDIAILYFVLVPSAPLVLETQGFYTRPMLGSRLAMLWPLLKGCVILTIARAWLLDFACHRRGKRMREVAIPFSRVRLALSKLWLAFPCWFVRRGTLKL